MIIDSTGSLAMIDSSNVNRSNSNTTAENKCIVRVLILPVNG